MGATFAERLRGWVGKWASNSNGRHPLAWQCHRAEFVSNPAIPAHLTQPSQCITRQKARESEDAPNENLVGIGRS